MIKKIFFISLFIFSSLTSGRSFAQATLSIDAPKEADVVPGVLYLQFKAKHGIDFDHLSPTHTGNAEVDNLFASIGVTDIYPFDADAKNYAVSRRHGIDRIFVINFSGEGLSPHDIGHEFLSLGVVERESPRYMYHPCYTPNDPQVSNQYALDNMHIKDGWGFSKGSSNIVIADIDVGVNYDHEDLAANIFLVEGHIGKDIVGDKGWWGKFQPDFDPMPHIIPGISPVNHGTLTSGCFGAIPDNGIGIAGSGFKCKIMIVKVANDSGLMIYGGDEGIVYAATHGAKILNCSWGGNVSDKAAIAFDQNIIDMAIDTGVMIVAAAGNASQNLDKNFFDPACLNNVLCVGASDVNDQPASFTNFGKEAQVYAPGTGIYSTSFPGNSAYDYDQGTSFSCPLTSGVAGLVWALHPDWTQKFVMRQIIQTCDNVVNPSNRAQYWGRVNALSALTLSTVPGVGITDFSIDGVDKGGLQYLNKVYSLNVTFKNYMANGSGIQARLLHVDGSVAPNGAYTIQQGVATLGTMSSLQQITELFKFTRDSTDQGAGSQLSLYFAISYGGSTVENQKYYDTLRLDINITGDDSYVSTGVAEENSNILQLGNSYPNPVTDEASIDFELARTGYIKLELCDVLGRSAGILAEGVYGVGKQSVHCDARNLPDGIYFYKLETSDGAVMTKRMIVAH